MMRAARKRLGLRTDEVTRIGDTMDTDIRGAAELVYRTVLVLTGSTTVEDLAMYPFAPTRVVDSIAELLLEGLSQAAEGTRAGWYDAIRIPQERTT